ncbi:MAG: hypothetical protein KBC56_01215 [Flavobacterium sp.]|nr:hypothetical protein [Flavobacterium sp.]
MKLKRGIMIQNQLSENYDVVRINSGSVFHNERIPETVNFNGYQYTPQYNDDAYIVKRDWRKLTTNEKKVLSPSGNCNDYNTVYLGEIPKDLTSCFEDLKLSNSNTRDEVLQKFSQDPQKTKELSVKLDAFLSKYANKKPYHFHCIGVNHPNIEMVACDTTKLASNFKPSDVQFMGLHNDGTKLMTIHTAHKFGNRISINLSNESRSFIFVNLSMIQAFNMLKKKVNVMKDEVNIANIPQYFFKYFPDYPVLKIDLKPYQYYIAPTDNCFHDGSTLGNVNLDICLVYFGSFQN